MKERFDKTPLQARFAIDRKTNMFVPASPIAPGDRVEGDVVIKSPEAVRQLLEEISQAVFPLFEKIDEGNKRAAFEFKKLGPFA